MICYVYGSGGLIQGDAELDGNAYRVKIEGLTKTKSISIKRFEGTYGATPDEAKIKYFKIEENRLDNNIMNYETKLNELNHELSTLKETLNVKELLEQYPEEFL